MMLVWNNWFFWKHYWYLQIYVTYDFCKYICVHMSTESIDLKIGLDLENWVIHVWKEWFLEIRIASCKLMQLMIICK